MYRGCVSMKFSLSIVENTCTYRLIKRNEHIVLNNYLYISENCLVD